MGHFGESVVGSRIELCARRVGHTHVRQRVRRLLNIFKEVCRADELILDEVRSKIVYHRLNEHYRDAHSLAWLLLDGLGMRDLLAAGETGCFAFLIDMNRLFEKFVYKLIDQMLKDGRKHAHYQRGDRSIIFNVSTNQPYAKVIPNVLVEDSLTGARVAIDAKYKLYDERKLSSGDVYQSFLYAYAYAGVGGQGLPASLLIYPSLAGYHRSVRLRIRSAQKVAAAEIFTLGLSIPDALSEVRHGVPGPASNAVLEAINRGLGGHQYTTESAKSNHVAHAVGVPAQTPNRLP